MAQPSPLAAADGVCGDSDEPCAPYLHALRDMLAELSNGHTGVWLDHEVADVPLVIEPIENRAVITWIREGSKAEASGLKVGQWILAVDGVPVEDALKAVPAWAVAYVAPHTRRYCAHLALLFGPPETGTKTDRMGRCSR